MLDLEVPPRIYDTRTGSGFPGAGEPFAAGEARKIEVPFSGGCTHVAVQLTVIPFDANPAVPLDPAGYARAFRVGVDPAKLQHSNVNWQERQVRSNSVPTISLVGGTAIMVQAMHRCHVAIDWVGFIPKAA